MSMRQTQEYDGLVGVKREAGQNERPKGNSGWVAIHTGEFLREDFLKPLQLSVNALSLALRVPATRISEIVNERRAITADTAIRFSLYLGTTPDFWMNMQNAYELAISHSELLPRLRTEIQPRAAQATAKR